MYNRDVCAPSRRLGYMRGWLQTTAFTQEEFVGEILVGCGQIGWPAHTSEEEILAEIAQAGYAGAPAYPRGGRSAQETVALWARYGLRPAPGYLGADFWRPQEREQILKRAREMARFMRDVGCTELYVATGGFESYVTASGRNRKQLAGRVSPADGLTDAEWRQFAETLNRVAEITLEEGVRSCFHNHVGSLIETAEEFERLLELTDPALLFLGPDTGHLAWAGADVVAFCRQYADRIKTVHLKDVHLDVVERGREAGWDYDAFCRNGLFTELGEGDVDFPALFAVLRAAGFSGWVIVETDVPERPTMAESIRVSREYLRRIGVG
ncbi:MAG: sugar phosphate isomerase/epimerase [Anaerolineae bacterium]|nr:sugar phosphate isomerase/epimerase [Anaerolineae bacterium]